MLFVITRVNNKQQINFIVIEHTKKILIHNINIINNRLIDYLFNLYLDYQKQLVQHIGKHFTLELYKL